MRQGACRKEPEGRLETRPLPRDRHWGRRSAMHRRLVADSSSIRRAASHRDSKKAGDAVKRSRQEERARQRQNPLRSNRCRVPHRAGHGCRESISQAASPCRTLVGVTWAANGKYRSLVPLRGLPSAGAGLQPLRPGPDLLRRRLRPSRSSELTAGCRQALSKQPTRPLHACRTQSPLPAPPAQSDASGFYATGTK